MVEAQQRRMDDDEQRAGCSWMRMIYPDDLEEYWIKDYYNCSYRIFSFPSWYHDSPYTLF